VEDGRGKSRQVVLSSTELLGFPGMGESLGGQLGVAEHVFQGGVIKGTVSGWVEGVLRGGGGGLASGGGWVLGMPRMPTHKAHAQTPVYQSVKKVRSTKDTSRSSLRRESRASGYKITCSIHSRVIVIISYNIIMRQVMNMMAIIAQRRLRDLSVCSRFRMPIG